MEGKVIIMFGRNTVVLFRSDLNEVVETSDGINFHLKGGSFFSYNDQYLMSETKQRIKITVDRYPNATVTINFNNSKQPVFVEIN